MKNITIRSALFTLSIIASMAMLPNVASAKPTVHIDLLGISIGFNDQRYNNRDINRYRNNSYRRQYSPSHRSTTRKSYRNNNQYYYQPNRRTYTPSYPSKSYPQRGHSPSHSTGHGCTQHYDHYHCD